MSITREYELQGMKAVSEAVACTLAAMIEYAQPGMSTKQLDNYGENFLAGFGARSAPQLTYNFPGCACISVNREIAHGIPSDQKILKEGDLVNIDVSAELNGYWSDNGSSIVIGNDIRGHRPLVTASRNVLYEVIAQLQTGMAVNEIGRNIQNAARNKGFKVIRNLTGHGIGKKLHESPREIANYHDPRNTEILKANVVVAIETFISTSSVYADVLNDGWTLVGNKGGYVAQQEHTVWVSANGPVILTSQNGI